MSNPIELSNDSSDMSQYTVVMVDDEKNILQALKRCFSREQFVIKFAGSGAEGLKLLAETTGVAVIVSDQRMPEMNGSEFLALSREYAPEAIRVLLTGYSDIETTIEAMNEGGATHYIGKPWEDTALIQTVQDCVRQYHLLLENRQQHETINRQNSELRELLCQLTVQNTELERLSSTDALTGLTNRRQFLEYLGKELSRTQRYGGKLSLIMFDIDHFKLVNDTWGHSAGDAVLCEIASQAVQVLRKPDITARFGGEEFVILLPETALSGAFLIADRLRQLIADTVVTQENGSQVSVTISIGLATLAPDESAQTLLNRADQAMYQAKHNGRNRVEISSMETK